VIACSFVSRASFSRPIFLPALALSAAIACADADGRETQPTKPTEGDAGVDRRGAKKMRIVRSEKSVEVEVGSAVDLVVTRPVAIPSELRYEWPVAPSIEGGAVRFVRSRVEEPPPDVDGGVTTHHYELDAVSPGTARVTLAPRTAGREASPPPVLLDVTVRAAGATEAAKTTPGIPELVRALVEVVATSTEPPLAIARSFGEVESDSEGGVYVRPFDARLKRVVVVKRPGTGALNDVELQLDVPGSVRPAELEALWGAPSRPPALAIETRTLIFRPTPPAGARFRATVTLTLDGDEAGPATWVKVIRDAL
jgi:hypothetical protein